MSFVRLAAGALLACLAVSASAGSFDGFTLNGDAALAEGGAVLRVVPTGSFHRGSAFLAEPIPLAPDTSFSATFSFLISGGGGADGFAFVVQNAEDGPEALGGSGGYVGYHGLPASLGVVFDTFNNGWASDPGGDNVAIVSGGDVTTGPSAVLSAPLTLRGEVRHAWVDYSAEEQSVSVYFGDTADKPQTPVLRATGYDLTSIVGDRMYVGFTAGTGSLDDNHDILSFEISVSPLPVPEPEICALLCIGLAVVGAASLRRRAAA